MFYFKSKDPWSEPLGVVVLEQCQVRVDPPMASPPLTTEGHYPFYLGEFLKIMNNTFLIFCLFYLILMFTKYFWIFFSIWLRYDLLYNLYSISVFDGGLCQALASTSDLERSSWMDTIRQASYEGIRAELNALRQCIERKRNHKPNIDLQSWRLQHGYIFGKCLLYILKS